MRHSARRLAGFVMRIFKAHTDPIEDPVVETIEQEFAPRGILRGSVLYLRKKDALDMVQRCRERGIRVLGIDGFLLTEQAMQPLMEKSIDLSGLDPDAAWTKAVSFLSACHEPDLYFEIVVDP